MTGSATHFHSLVMAASSFFPFSTEKTKTLLAGWLGLPRTRETEPEPSPRSCLNHNCYPLQLCLSARADGRIKARFIADPGSWIVNPSERHSLARDSLRQVMNDCRASGLLPLAKALLEEAVRKEGGAPHGYHMGTLWVAGCPGVAGAGLYVDMQPLNMEPGQSWAAAEAAVRRLLAKPGAALNVLEHLDRRVTLAALSLEGLNPERCRLKLYFRLAHPAPLESLGLPGLAGAEMEDFVSVFMGHSNVQLSGLVIATGYELVSGGLADVKLDLCGCPRCLGRPNQPEDFWSKALERFGGDTCLNTSPLIRAATLPGLETAMIGQGLGVDGSRRLNLYLAPRIQASAKSGRHGC